MTGRTARAAARLTDRADPSPDLGADHMAHGDRRGYRLRDTSTALDDSDRGLLHLGELVPQLRSRLFIDDKLADQQIFDSLKSIAARTEPRARWLTAFNSPLGHWLVLRGSDLNTALNLTLSLLPPPRS